MIDLSKITCIFFDLDATLLGLEDSIMAEIYPKLVYERFKDDIDFDTFLKAIMRGTELMYQNKDANVHLFDIFFDNFAKITGLDYQYSYDKYIDFYSQDVDPLQEHVVDLPEAVEIVKWLKNKDLKLILATNPVFPQVFTDKRIKWAKLDKEDFLIVTTGENFNYCKPHPEYYKKLLHLAGVTAEETLMVGNSYFFDGSASLVGIKTWITPKYASNLEAKSKFQIDEEGSLIELLTRFKSL